MRARYYNPEIKRFINQDVIEGNITNSPSLNKYAYCQGNPVSLLDPFGLKLKNKICMRMQNIYDEVFCIFFVELL